MLNNVLKVTLIICAIIITYTVIQPAKPVTSPSQKIEIEYKHKTYSDQLYENLLPKPSKY